MGLGYLRRGSVMGSGREERSRLGREEGDDGVETPGEGSLGGVRRREAISSSKVDE